MALADNTELLKFLEAFPPDPREIALALRELVWDLYPDSNELIYDNYNFLAFGWAATDRTGDTFCSIAVGMNGVVLGFTWGVELDDPLGLLQGGGKQFRSIRVPDMGSFPADYAKQLLEQAYVNSITRLKTRPVGPKGQTIVKSISEKQRRPGMKKDEPKLRREKYPMPDLISKALKDANLFDAYNSRPPYQQNDYIGWITTAKREETKHARLAQMLDVLRRGDTYMKMPYKAKSS